MKPYFSVRRRLDGFAPRALTLGVAVAILATGAASVTTPAVAAPAPKPAPFPRDLPALPSVVAAPRPLEIPTGDYTNPPPNPSDPKALLACALRKMTTPPPAAPNGGDVGQNGDHERG